MYAPYINIVYLINKKLIDNMDAITYKWANPLFDDFEKKLRCNMKYMIKRINTNYHRKVTQSVTK